MFGNGWLIVCKNSAPRGLPPQSPQRISGVENGNSHRSCRNPVGNPDKVRRLCPCPCLCLCRACCNFPATHQSTYQGIQLLRRKAGTNTTEWWRCDLSHLALRRAMRWSHAAKWCSWAAHAALTTCQRNETWSISQANDCKVASEGKTTCPLTSSFGKGFKMGPWWYSTCYPLLFPRPVQGRHRITAEVEQHSILLRNVDQLSCLGMTECQFARSTEGDANGAVLVGSPLLIECCLHWYLTADTATSSAPTWNS